ncbi:MAG: YqgE/AlgH family protein [Nitrospiraceae bacterium]|nr:YqgE/AlgH family protein [Nitrospiraceae bacterium]
MPAAALIIFFLLSLLPGAARAGEVFPSAGAGRFLAYIREPGIPVKPVLPEAIPSTGKFLVAGRGIKDPRFQQSVILIVKFDPQGVMGLIINRPTDIKVSAVLPDVEMLRKHDQPLYFGGPVAKHQIFVLIKSRVKPEKTYPVSGDVYVSHEQATLEQKDVQDAPVRVYTGCAGWAAEQLEGEIARGDWHVVDADPEDIFERPAADIWPLLMKRISEGGRL